MLWLPPRSVQTHLVEILQALVTRPAASADHLTACLRSLLERDEKRGLAVVVSDLMFDPDPVRKQLSRLQAQGHEVLLFQIRDPVEEDFPFNRWVQFTDREDPARRHRLDTVPLRRIYREEYQALLEEWRAWAKKFDIHFVTFRSDANVQTMLWDYMAMRGEIAGKR